MISGGNLRDMVEKNWVKASVKRERESVANFKKVDRVIDNCKRF